jgi:hypothetical protein
MKLNKNFLILLLLVIHPFGLEAREKNLPYGIFWLPPVSASFQQDTPSNWACWNAPYNAHLVGVVARESWEELEPTQGTFKFSTYLGSVASLAKANGFYFEIEIPTGQAANGKAFWPSWLTGLGMQTVTLHNPDGSGVTVPLPWDPVFLSQWQALINAIGAQYDGNVYLRVVQMTGPGRQGELFFAENGNDAANLAAQYGPTWPWLWQYAAETIATYYNTAFPTTPITYSTGRPLPKTSDPNNATMAAVVQWCYFMYNMGSPWVFGTRDSGFYAGGPVPLWSNFFQGYQQTLPVGSGAAAEVNEVYKSPYNGLWFEVYQGDCQTSSNFNAFDAMNAATLSTVGSGNYQ